MKIPASLVAVAAMVLSCSPLAHAQTPATPAATDVYTVSFFKAAPGQAAALAKTLQEQDPKDPMAGHALLLRHAQGSDWDYCLIQHRGTSATVRPPAPAAAAPPPMPTQAWHTDTYVSGPSWEAFSKLMLAEGDSVYVVGVHRAVPGHRRQLLDALNQPDPNAKVPSSRLTLEHIDGAFAVLSLERYASWQNFATDMAANPSGGQGWNDVRQHSAFHEDTLAERVR